MYLMEKEDKRSSSVSNPCAASNEYRHVSEGILLAAYTMYVMATHNQRWHNTP